MTGAVADVGDAWREVFEAPLLRGLDQRGRTELAKAGALLSLAEGERVFGHGERGQAVYVVARGGVSLSGVRRGEELVVELRQAGAGDSFGEEASVGATFRADATAVGAAVVAELPVQMLRRVLERAGGGEVADRFERRVRRRATLELLATASFTARLPARDRELLLDAAEHRPVLRGDTIYRMGEPATHLWLVADGMVQLQTEDDERIRVRAYLARGDFFGDEEVIAGAPRRSTAVASGASLLVAIAADAARTVIDRNPDLLRRLRRVDDRDLAVQGAPLRQAALSETQHAFRDLYRLQVARSLLVIDLNHCVRCGHCAWACETLHGVARLVRRGDKVVTQVAGVEERTPLLLPNSCQHCENPACMPDCPTGAIGRDPRGEVFIRDALCTGCGACAKGCPWDNIQIVPRPPDAARPEGSFPDLAVKCDLCVGYDGPACVKACPTEAIWRINPSDDLPEVGAVLGMGAAGRASPRGPAAVKRARWPLLSGAWALGAGIATYGIVEHARGIWTPWRGAGYAWGIVAALLLVALGAYSLPKRLVRWWSKPRPRPRAEADAPRPRTRSLVAPQLTLHVAIGAVSLGPALAHAGFRTSPSSGGGLLVAFLASALVGTLAVLSYWLVPRRLARIEKSAVLPEDYKELRRELSDRLYAGVTGKSELVKRIFEKMLVPYLRRPLGWVALLAGGGSLADEQKSLRSRIDRALEGRGTERLAGLDQLIRLVVELRALTAQRILGALLRGLVPLHVVLAALAAALLVAHLIEVLS